MTRLTAEREAMLRKYAGEYPSLSEVFAEVDRLREEIAKLYAWREIDARDHVDELDAVRSERDAAKAKLELLRKRLTHRLEMWRECELSPLMSRGEKAAWNCCGSNLEHQLSEQDVTP